MCEHCSNLAKMSYNQTTGISKIPVSTIEKKHFQAEERQICNDWNFFAAFVLVVVLFFFTMRRFARLIVQEFYKCKNFKRL